MSAPGGRFAITITLSPKLRRNLQQVYPAIAAGLHAGLDDLALQVVNRAKRAAPIHTGHLARSIDKQTPIGEPLTREVGSNVKYAPFIEFGTKPHWPPFAAIRDWVWLNRGKFGISGRGKGAQATVDRVALAVQRKIAAHGTAKKPYLVPAFQQVLPKIKPTLEGYVRRILSQMDGG